MVVLWLSQTLQRKRRSYTVSEKRGLLSKYESMTGVIRRKNKVWWYLYNYDHLISMCSFTLCSLNTWSKVFFLYFRSASICLHLLHINLFFFYLQKQLYVFLSFFKVLSFIVIISRPGQNKGLLYNHHRS